MHNKPLNSAKRTSQSSLIFTNIGNGMDEFPDFAIITHTGYVDNGIIIIKIHNKIGCFDYSDFKNGKYTIIQYQELKTPEQAYNKLMYLIGKMCKRPINVECDDLEFFEREPLDKSIFNNALINYIMEKITTN